MVKVDLKLFEEYLKLKRLRPRTIKEYLYLSLRFQNETSGEGGNITFSTQTITRFLVGKNLMAKSFVLNFKRFLLHYKLELAIKDEELKEIIESEVPSISGRTKVKLVVPLTKPEIDLLEQTLDTEQDKLMLLICYNGGLRLQELMGIKISSFNWEQLKQNPEEMGEVRVYGKGGKEGICLLPNWLIRRIGAYIKGNSFKYGLESHLFKFSGRNFEIKLRNAGIKAGLSRMGENGEYIKETIVHPHRLRHSYAYNLLKKGVDIRYIKEALRHSSISSTQIYTSLSKEDLKEKLKGIN